MYLYTLKLLILEGTSTKVRPHEFLLEIISLGVCSLLQIRIHISFSVENYHFALLKKCTWHLPKKFLLVSNFIIFVFSVFGEIQHINKKNSSRYLA